MLEARLAQRVDRLFGVLVGLAAAVVIAAGCNGGSSGSTGVTVSGKGVIDLDTWGWTDVEDDPTKNSIDCTPMNKSGNTVEVTAKISEQKTGESFNLVVDFDATSLQVSMATLKASEQGMTYVGDDCTGTVSNYLSNGAAFSTKVQCQTTNGGSGPPISVDAQFQFCHAVAGF